MPELPEVETLRRGLEQGGVPGQRVLGVQVANPKVLKGQSTALFEQRVVGSTIERIERRGKYLLLPLLRLTPATALDGAPAISLCIHLKMRGQLLLEASGAPVGKYHCVTLGLDSGRVLRFYDMWTWGEMRALTGNELVGIAGLAGMGREPLEASWGADHLAKALATRRGAAIKPTLLDQRVLAGVGNIYADEALFRAGIRPERAAGSLTPNEIGRLADALRGILAEAVQGGGTTSDNYVNVDGVAGRYTPRVYDRGGQPCQACGTTLTRIRLGGRGTVFCARCQA